MENTLERTVLGLTSELQRERREKVIEKRTNIAITALEAAGLPKAPKVKDIDLDARFRDSLIAAATAANSDTEAQELVAEMIAERRALMQGAAQEGQRGRGAATSTCPWATTAARTPAAPTRACAAWRACARAPA
ncbi:hypothetical protein [Deinococcus multiflagellatus]|uniref:Uncharacterized protein n=1 Tax=Deinococcus multiflagellatus TaxID=1656887 RepID=A0ABW1ZIH6_9DEIO